MGVSTSLPDDSDTSFTAGEVTRLAARFRKIDSDKSGTISVSEFLSLPELGQNPLARRIIGKVTSNYFVFIILHVHVHIFCRNVRR